MESDFPVFIMAFIRPDLLRKSLSQLAKFSPPILYVVADGPRNEKEEFLCSESRKIAMNPGWDCEIIPIFSDRNQGLVPSFLRGMNQMFKDHEYGIFLEDDISVFALSINMILLSILIFLLILLNIQNKLAKICN